MAGFTRTHGDAQPVFAMDTLNGPIASSAAATGATTNLIGPGMDFFSFDLGAAPTSQLGVSGAISAVLQSLEQLTTVMIYAVQPTANVTNMSVGLYPLGAYGNVSDGTAAYVIQTQIRALGTVNGYSLSSAVCEGAAASATAADGSNQGFRLASTPIDPS